MTCVCQRQTEKKRFVIEETLAKRCTAITHLLLEHHSQPRIKQEQGKTKSKRQQRPIAGSCWLCLRVRPSTPVVFPSVSIDDERIALVPVKATLSRFLHCLKIDVAYLYFSSLLQFNRGCLVHQEQVLESGT